jgi:sodium/proline symporter
MKQSSIAVMVLSLAALLLVIGAAWSARRLHSASDFFVGSRRSDVWVTALSYTANAMPPWLLLVVSGSAFAWGLSAIWVWAALVLGFLLNWFFVALRLRAAAASDNALSVLQILSFDAGDRLQLLIRCSASLILLVALMLLAAAQLHAAAGLAAATVGISATTLTIWAGVALTLYVLIGGYPAASMSDVGTVLIMLMIALFLPVPAVLAADGTAQLKIGFAALGPEANDWFAGRTGVVALAFALGVSAMGFALAGQPHALGRFMAARDVRTLQQARWISLGCVVVMPWMMLLCGWCAKVLYEGLNDPGLAIFAIGNRTLPPWLATLVATLAISALVASMGGPLLAAAASLALDLRSISQRASLAWAHIALLFCAVGTLLLALYAREGFLSQSMLALNMMGSSIGPLLLVRLGGKRVRPGSTLGAMWSGALLTLIFHLLPDAPGDFLERVVPFVAALGIALTGGQRRRNPDRADRNQQTVHDRVPI